MPVRLSVKGREVDGAWGMDVMVAPERQRQGLGEVLFRTWDRNVGASLGLGLSDSSYRLFQKLQLARRRAGAVPRQAAQPARAAPADLAGRPQPARLGGHAAVDPARRARRVRCRARCGRSGTSTRASRGCGSASRRSSRSPSGATRAYLNWKFIQRAARPLLDRRARARRRGRRLRRLSPRPGAARPRHAARRLPRRSGRRGGLLTLLRWIDREARAADSDKIRTFALHEGFRKLLRKSGYYSVKSTMEFVAKVNGVDVPPSFYETTERWHVTLGDSDQDR